MNVNSFPANFEKIYLTQSRGEKTGDFPEKIRLPACSRGRKTGGEGLDLAALLCYTWSGTALRRDAVCGGTPYSAISVSYGDSGAAL